MRIRTLALMAMALLLSATGAALAGPRPSVNLGLTSARAGAPARVTVRADLGGTVRGTLMSYEVELARGFAFDARAAGPCRGRALRQDSCPALSRIGVGTGRIAVEGQYLPRTEYGVTASLYLTAPGHRGDLAGVLLDLDEPQSALQVALSGSVVAVPQGRYGLELRFTNTARELPSTYSLTVADLEMDLGAMAYKSGRLRSLFTNPSVCSGGGWPIAVAVQSGRVRRAFGTRTRCY
jgi:hypothetical protein